MTKGGYISSRATKDIMSQIMIHDESPRKIAEENNLLQTSDKDALKTFAEKAIKENPEAVASYKSGKENAIMSLVGKVIKESKGSANPKMVIEILKSLLK